MSRSTAGWSAMRMIVRPPLAWEPPTGVSLTGTASSCPPARRRRARRLRHRRLRCRRPGGRRGGPPRPRRRRARGRGACDRSSRGRVRAACGLRPRSALECRQPLPDGPGGNSGSSGALERVGRLVRPASAPRRRSCRARPRPAHRCLRRVAARAGRAGPRSAPLAGAAAQPFLPAPWPRPWAPTLRPGSG